MKRIWLFALFASVCYGQTTTYTGTVKDLTGAAVTSGRITFTTNAPTASTLPGTGAFISSTVSCLISSLGHPVSSSDGVSPCVILNNTSLTPTGTSYTMCFQPNYVTPGSCIGTYATGGTVDISNIVPTPATQPSYGAASTNIANTWSQKQTLTGGALITGGLTVDSIAPSVATATMHIPFTGTYSSTYNDEFSILSDGADGSVVWTASQGSVGGTSALSGGIKVPVSSAAHQANGVYGFVQNNSAGTTNGVGGYFASLCTNSALCWGINPWTSDTAGFPSSLFGTEINVNVNNTGSVGYGLGIVGFWTAQPTGQMQAIDIVKPTGGNYSWNTGIQIETGATGGSALYINPLASGLGQPSQNIVLVSTGSGSNTMKLFEDSTGGFNIKYQNNATVTMPQPPATGGFPIGAPLVTSGSYTITGCSTSAHIGNGSAGYFNSGTAGTCSVTITPGITAPTGWVCARPQDITTPADTNSWQQTGYTTTSIGFSGTTANGDQIIWGPCVAF